MSVESIVRLALQGNILDAQTAFNGELNSRVVGLINPTVTDVDDTEVDVNDTVDVD